MICGKRSVKCSTLAPPIMNFSGFEADVSLTKQMVESPIRTSLFFHPIDPCYGM